MNEFINKIKSVNNLTEIDSRNDIDPNVLFLAIVKSKRYDLLKDCNIKLHIDNSETSIQLIEYLLSDGDILYYIHQSGYSFSKEDIEDTFKIVCQKYQDEYQFDVFFRNFFNSKEALNDFIKENEGFFINYLHQNGEDVSYKLKECDNFVELILKEKRIKLIRDLENYSLSNLKLLATILKTGTMLPYYLGNNLFAYHLFDLKSNLEPDEFCQLLNLLKEKSSYDRKGRNSESGVFTNLVNENIDYLINVVSQSGFVPTCLVESDCFRDGCIKRNRFDLAVQCILPKDIFQNDNLVEKYCNELKIDLKDFYSRGKWVLDYYEKNNNVFNSLVATTLKNNIFNLGEEHIERFSNDISVQIAISKLNDKENKMLHEILERYTYQDYDISFMVTNILTNIKDYNELINSLDLSSITSEDVKSLVSILQVSKNPYKIVNVDDLKNYIDRKKEFFEKNYSNDTMDFNKDNLLKLILNINFNEAAVINNQFCYDRNKCVLKELSNSELPKNLLEYLKIINRIVETENQQDIIDIYNQYKDNNIYSKELPLETYLRSEYTKLYSALLYRVEEKENVYGPKESIFESVNYNGKDIKVCIPRGKLNMLVHALGYCSLDSDVIESNYQRDWEFRPQMQDHLVACSYITEKSLYSTISDNRVIYGFDSLESGSLFGMGDTDIDSIGYYSRLYSPSKELMEGNGNRAHYFVPSLLAKTTESYNEVVIERRNCNCRKKDHFKRSPDYIVMMTNSLEQNNLTRLSDLYNDELSFISEDDRKLIVKAKYPSDIKKILNKYNEVLSEEAIIKNVGVDKLLNAYVSLILSSKNFEENIRAASEFDIPLIIIDRLYYFNKMLSESEIYDEETKHNISLAYLEADDLTKKRIFNGVAKGMDATKFIKKQESIGISIRA